jgi:anti-sigma B factor antagonist
MNYSHADAAAGPLRTELFLDERDLRLAFSGELDLAGAAAARTAMLEGLAYGQTLWVDLSGLSFIDSAGLGVLVRMAEVNGPDELRFLGPVAPPVGRVLTLTGLDAMLAIKVAEPPLAPL